MHDDAFFNLIRYATVLSVDVDSARLVARIGDVTTRPLPWLAPSAGVTRTWSPPSPGEQILVLSPGGDIGAAVALAGIFSRQRPKPDQGTADNVLMVFGDGALVQYDQAAHLLQATLPDTGRVEMEASGGFRLVGNLDVDGEVHVTKTVRFDANLDAGGDVTSKGDVKAGDISLRKHPHDRVQSGTELSGGPQP